ncbi:MAG TPA: hypothetical protein VFC47_01385 [Caulobacteraceae bacterium]|nr:hypothetical protein [Caulobacteraceae bacterium]
MASDTLEIVTVTPLSPGAERAPSAVSWAAVIAGAFVAAATSLILLALGSGLGFAKGSPGMGAGSAVATFTIVTGIWLIIVQWVASGVGGYLTGRLRTRWAALHDHEVFFRDTAHGFLTWAVATVMVALLVAGAASLAVGLGTRAANTNGASGPYAYDADGLFRSSRPDDSASAPAVRAEAGRILTKDVAAPAPPPDDRAYLAGLVAARTGLAPADAQRRVDTTLAAERDAADKARKAASATSLFTALAMLIGALIACAAAALGGQRRDQHA